MGTAVVNVYLVRHGETEENRAMIMQGQLDTKLNPAGIEQAQLAASALENVHFVAAYSSDLSRAAKTAEIILKKHPHIPLQTHQALRERYMGSLQGQEIGRSRQPGGLPSDVEPTQSFSARAHSWWRDTILPYATSQPELGQPEEATNILVVSHGGLMHVMVQNLIESRKVKVGKDTKLDKFRFPNASVSVIELERSGKGTLVMFADTTHLDVELVDGNADIIDQQ